MPTSSEKKMMALLQQTSQSLTQFNNVQQFTTLLECGVGDRRSTVRDNNHPSRLIVVVGKPEAVQAVAVADPEKSPKKEIPKTEPKVGDQTMILLIESTLPDGTVYCTCRRELTVRPGVFEVELTRMPASYQVAVSVEKSIEYSIFGW